ncbi:MAG TPA: SDR family oxidoreductase [Candidatus Sulfotelmatobacter sp.]|nr:SDR family oxidoreductase [Candidatus Sulfotelmatobacter sp.]
MASARKSKVLVTGASGLVGRSAVEHFAALPDWEVLGVSRRPPDLSLGARLLPLDLTDGAACRTALARHGDLTHIVYAAVHEKADLTRGWTEADQVATNLAMLRNIVEAAEAAAPQLSHVTLLQGTKAYGVHLGPFKVPAKESSPRHMPPNFYYDQEDWLRAAAAGKSWRWTVLRPQIVCGFALNSAMNVLTSIGTYAAISRELGLPLRFPGGEPRILEMTDARLLARAIAWAATSERAAGEIFNITNGDCFEWPTIWPRVAEAFGMALGPAQPCRLQRVMADKAPIWDRIVAKHRLAPHALAALVPSWQYADFTFGYGSRPNPVLLSTIKARQFGFPDCIDTESMLIEWLGELQRRNILPR